MLRTMRSVSRGHFTSYHRVFSRASWSLWPLGRILAAAILKWIPEEEPVVVAIDDTTAQHRGKKVYGKGCHHDAVRSTHKHVVFKWGHKWVVLAITVKFPFASRAWALPILAALCRPEELNRAECELTKSVLRSNRGIVRQRRPSPTPWPRCAGFSGRKPFLNSRENTGVSKNYPRN